MVSSPLGFALLGFRKHAISEPVAKAFECPLDTLDVCQIGAYAKYQTLVGSASRGAVTIPVDPN